MKSDADAHALRRFEQALQVARHGNKKFDEADALNMLGKVLASTCSERVIVKILNVLWLKMFQINTSFKFLANGVF